MASSTWHWRLITWVLSLGRRRARMCFAAVAIAAIALPGTALSAPPVTPPTLAVVILGTGVVASQPAGITCPGKCTATFAAGTSVLLTPESKHGSTFLRWSGSCTGIGTCTVKVSALTAVAAQFVGGQKAQPQPVTTKSVAVPGPYSGTSGQGWRITFYVAPGGTSVENLSIPTTSESCTSSGNAGAPVGVLQAAIQPDGSFSAKTSQNGVLNGVNAKFTYAFAGYFEGPTPPAGAATVAGIWREDVVFASGTTTMCTSNDQSWTATLQSYNARIVPTAKSWHRSRAVAPTGFSPG